MFSYKWTKSLECLKIKKFKLANKVNIINKNVSIHVSIFIFELNYNVYIGTCKTETSYRTIPIGDTLLNLVDFTTLEILY